VGNLNTVMDQNLFAQPRANSDVMVVSYVSVGDNSTLPQAQSISYGTVDSTGVAIVNNKNSRQNGIIFSLTSDSRWKLQMINVGWGDKKYFPNHLSCW
jgi:hypothetical protein